ncbi:hypothetical protein [Leptospira noguchii]|nr:hypothetical protein [Leptospira noguchii]
MIIGYKAKPEVNKKSRREFEQNWEAELFSSEFICKREPNFSYAISSYIQATLMKPFLTKYAGDIKAHFASEALLKFFKLSGSISRDKTIAEGAACQ